MSKDAPQEELSPDGKRRRTILGSIAALGIGGATFGGGGLLSRIGSKKHKQSADEGNENHHDMPKWLDWGTASAVAGVFADQVLYKGAKKGIELSATSASRVGAAVLGRIGALYAFGGKEGAHHGHEEVAEIEHGLLPLPVLVALSDATTTELEVDSEAIFDSVEKSLKEDEKVTKIDYDNPPRPNVDDSTEKWQDYLEKVNADLTEKAAQIAAITSVLAPIGTTYTSSSLANTLKEEVLKILYEQSYALGVIDFMGSNGDKEYFKEISNETMSKYETLVDKISDAINKDKATRPKGSEAQIRTPEQILDTEEIVLFRSVEKRISEQIRAKMALKDKRMDIEDAAIERADKLMNGNAGFSKLMFTLAANTNGTWGIGDPPEIYFAINHGKDLKTMGIAHALGAANSEAYTMLLNAAWLKAAGLPAMPFGGALVSSQKQVIKSLLKTIAGGELRDVSFSQGKGAAAKVIAALNDENDPGGELRRVLMTIPRAKLQFSLSKYLREKLTSLSGHAERTAAIPYGAIKDRDTFASHGDGFRTIEKLVRDDDSKGREQYIAALEDKIQTKEAIELAAMLEYILVHATDAPYTDAPYEEMSEPVPAPMDGDNAYREESEEIRHHRAVMTVIDKVLKGYREMGAEERDMRIDRARKYLDGKTDKDDKKRSGTGRARYETLRPTNDENVERAIAELTDIGPGEDVIPGLEKGTVPGETVTEAFKRKDESIHTLSHSAKEVLWALLTQIPSVPAIARLVKLILPKLTGVKDGEKPSTSQLKVIIGVMMHMEAVMSAFADNVAAYLFAENVLQSFFISAFGEDVLEQPTHIPGLTVKGMIGILSKMVAEQAGSMSQVGNGPNFSQEKVVLLKDPSRASGVAVDRVKIKMGETLPHKNYFSAFANESLVLASIGVLVKTIDKITTDQTEAEQPKPESTEEVQHSIRGSLKRRYDMWSRRGSGTA